MNSKRLRSLALLLVAVFFAGTALAACGDDDDGGDANNAQVTVTTTADDEDEDATTTTEASDEGEDAEPGDSAVEEFEATVTEEGDEYTDFEQITDDSGTLVVEVPVEWGDRNGEPNSSGDPALQASTDLEGDIEETPVLGYTAVETNNPNGQDLDALIETVADASTGGECTADAPQPYSDPAFTGRIQAFVDCGGDDRAWLFVAATPDNGDPYVAVIFGQAVTVADVDALQHAFDTFNIIA